MDPHRSAFSPTVRSATCDAGCAEEEKELVLTRWGSTSGCIKPPVFDLEGVCFRTLELRLPLPTPQGTPKTLLNPLCLVACSMDFGPKRLTLRGSGPPRPPPGVRQITLFG